MTQQRSPSFAHVLLGVTLLSASFSSGCFLQGRPNPQVKQISYDDGEKVKFKYDDSGLLTKVERSDGEGVSLKWEDDLLVKITDGDRETEIKYDDQNRIKQAKNADLTWDFGYDKEGRLADADAVFGDKDAGISGTLAYGFDYNDSGALAEIKVALETTEAGETSEAKGTLKHKFDGQRLMSVTGTGDFAGDGATTEYSYDDAGRLSGTSSKGKDVDDTTVALSYGDSGNVETITEKGPDFKDEVEISYGEGDAHGISVAPNELNGFFDVKGKSYNTLDTQAVLQTVGVLTW